MKHPFLPYLAVLPLLGLGAAHGATIECGTTYTVQPNDSLTQIAVGAYENANNWPLVYYANRELIGSDPGRIFPGMSLEMPCPDGTPAQQVAQQPAAPVSSQASAPVAPTPAPTPAPATAAQASVAAAAQPEPPIIINAALSRAASQPLTLVTGTDYSPFTDEGLPEGGMATEIVATALQASQFDYEIDWINDWGAHLNPLLSRRTYDLGFPWLKPDCSDPSQLSDSMRIRCDFIFSDPVFEMLVLMFRRADSDIEPKVLADFKDLKVCRPEGYFTHDLEAQGLKPGETFTFVTPRTVADCFQMMDRSEVDLVSLNEFTGREALATLSLEHPVVEMDRFATVQGLHIITHRLNPKATTTMFRINKALQAMRDQGLMQTIQTRHLERYYSTLEQKRTDAGAATTS